MKERTQKLFARLLSVNTYLTFEDLSKEFHISERTLRNELVPINRYLVENHYPCVTNTRGKGLKLSLSDHERKQLLDQVCSVRKEDYYRPNERFLTLLLEIADPAKTTWLYEMEEQLQVSKSTLDEDMRKLRRFLKDYGATVISLPKQGIVLQGHERSIRSMLYDVMNSMTDIDRLMMLEDANEVLSYVDKLVLDYLDIAVLETISNQYDEVLKRSRIDINHVYRSQVILFLGIWIRRMQEGCTISELTKVKAEINESPIRSFVDSICREFNLYPSLNEMKYVTFIIESFNPKDMNNSFDWVTAQLLTIQLIEHVEKVTRIPFSREQEDLYEGLYKHITGLLTRAKQDVQVFNPLKNTIRESYSNIYNAVTCFSKQIEFYIKKPLSEDEIGFLTIYFSTSQCRIKQEEQFVYQAVVLCNHGVSTGKLLAANLKELFNIEIVAVLSSYELDFIDKLDVDLIFTTIPIEYSKKPVLLLNPILRESDKKEIKVFLQKNKEKRRTKSNELDATKLLQDVLRLIEMSGGKVTKEIYKKVEDTFKEHNLKYNTREIQPMLQDILKNSYILLNQECQDWKEAITKVAQVLVEGNVIERRYINAMIKSVEDFGPYIVLGKNLALAHARPEDGVNKLGISVMTLKEPVVFGNPNNDPVKIIFCLAAVDSYSHLNIMKSLIELINDEEKLNQLMETNDVNTFQKILYGNEVVK
ncbi:BglG family transcription antiterminator [Weizmannia sp. FSL W8-0401]|uniref:BglG family transcription antiterminator n=1 Tax=Weizmannia sp. FSL W8-0401 TaxID=2954554 RepID=UPI0030F9B649